MKCIKMDSILSDYDEQRYTITARGDEASQQYFFFSFQLSRSLSRKVTQAQTVVILNTKLHRTAQLSLTQLLSHVYTEVPKHKADAGHGQTFTGLHHDDFRVDLNSNVTTAHRLLLYRVGSGCICNISVYYSYYLHSLLSSLCVNILHVFYLAVNHFLLL